MSKPQFGSLNQLSQRGNRHMVALLAQQQETEMKPLKRKILQFQNIRRSIAVLNQL
ncbi:MAG: hypothetical protein KME16_03080 [Scytolyngbya sp. HA4215-MV1]|jgi:hypothetical protein|nr:hypothetical protein [Scytolyngbya sp. HA4215-MV1]